MFVGSQANKNVFYMNTLLEWSGAQVVSSGFGFQPNGFNGEIQSSKPSSYDTVAVAVADFDYDGELAP